MNIECYFHYDDDDDDDVGDDNVNNNHYHHHHHHHHHFYWIYNLIDNYAPIVLCVHEVLTLPGVSVASLSAFSVCSVREISNSHPPISPSSVITSAIRSIRADAKMKNDSKCCVKTATSFGSEATSNRQTNSAANFSLLMSRLAYSWRKRTAINAVYRSARSLHE